MIRKSLSFFFAAVFLICAVVSLPAPASALALPTVFREFINDSRWCDGTEWGNSQLPKLSSAGSYRACAAYCADFTKYCFGADVPSSGQRFTDTSEIRSGDVLTIGNPYNGTGHWFVCLKRDGNRIYAAEGNCGSRVCIGWSYIISGSNTFSGESRTFTAGYHYMPKVTSVTLNHTSATLTRTSAKQKPVLQLTAAVEPAGADPTMNWSCSNPKVAEVDEYGKVTALKAGKATITCTASGGDIMASCRITVKDKKVSKITLNETKAILTRTSKDKNPVLQLKVKSLKPSTALNTTVKWTSSNPEVAVVNQKGKVTALKSGSVTITCTARDGSGVKASCRITVKNKKVTEIILKRTKKMMAVGQTYQVKVTSIRPKDAFNRKLKWFTSNKKVAVVDENGVVTAKKAGTCTIACKAADGSGIISVCEITVE